MSLVNVMSRPFVFFGAQLMFELLFSLMFECRIRPKRTALHLSLLSLCIPDIY